MIRQLLIVTDHTWHASTNSLYDLSLAISELQPEIKIRICSAGYEANKEFFIGKQGSSVYAFLLDSHFSFQTQMTFIQRSAPVDLDLIDAILIRMPQPLNPVFLRSLLSIVPPHKIVNHPEGIIETSSKAFLLTVSHLCPPVWICNSLEEAFSLGEKMEIVLKPFYSYGGIGILRVSTDEFWIGNKKYLKNKLPALTENYLFPMLAMKFLPNVFEGDKRTIVVNRKILGSALRLPAMNSWICNVAHEGHAILDEIDESEQIIEQELTPLLYEKGIIMYGFDTLVDDNGKRVLSEINTLSIGGLGPMASLSGRPIVHQAAEEILRYLNQ